MDLKVWEMDWQDSTLWGIWVIHRTAEPKKSSVGVVELLFACSVGLDVCLGACLGADVGSVFRLSLLEEDAIFRAAEAGKRVTFIIILPSNVGTTSSKSFTSYQTIKLAFVYVNTPSFLKCSLKTEIVSSWDRKRLPIMRVEYQIRFWCRSR